MQAPPVFSQVPPPPEKKTPWGVIAALIVIGLTVAASLFVALFFLVMKLPERSPPERPGFGHPVLVRRLDGNRALYKFPEVPMRLELPGTPRTYRFHWPARSTTAIAGWIGYRWESRVATYTLAGTWYRQPERLDLDKSIQRLQESYAKDKNYGGLNAKHYKTTIGPFEGREIRASYRYHNETRVLRLFLWQEGDHTFYLSMHALWKNREDGRWEQDEILKSIEFR